MLRLLHELVLFRPLHPFAHYHNSLWRRKSIAYPIQIRVSLVRICACPSLFFWARDSLFNPTLFPPYATFLWPVELIIIAPLRISGKPQRLEETHLLEVGGWSWRLPGYKIRHSLQRYLGSFP